jgi:cytoskeletal protein CcmA (bactofilin family)
MLFKSNQPKHKIETIIGLETEINGNLTTSQSVRIDGRVKGEVRAEAVVVGSAAVVMGDIFADHVTLAGKVKGNITAKDQFELLSSGQLIGDIETGKLIIAEGALFEGHCQMKKSEGQVIELHPATLVNKGENHRDKQHLKVANS